VREWECAEDLGETPLAYGAFTVYRDLGADRSLRATAQAVYGDRARHGIRTVEKWSSKYDWRDRVASYDAHLELAGRLAIEEHERARASETAARRERLREQLLRNEEKAAQLGAKALDRLDALLGLPPVRSRTTRSDDTGRPVEVILEPGLSDPSLTVSRLHRVARAGEPAQPLGDAGLHDVLFGEFGISDEAIEAEFEALVREERAGRNGAGEG